MESYQQPIMLHNPPWCEIKSSIETGGYLSFYYSDDMSKLPVRWVTKPGDNKSDPNIETLTYGLFSTCNRQMRSGIIKRKTPFIYFFTRRNNERVLTGFYHLRWYTNGVFQKNDFCFAADYAKFISTPISLREIDRIQGINISRPFRQTLLLSNNECFKLIEIFNKVQDATSDYIDEIDRLERFNLKHGGYRYIGWKQGDKFSWECARKYLNKIYQKNNNKDSIRNRSSTGMWYCISCDGIINNLSLLKRCPNCGSLATLIPKNNVN